MLIRYESDNLYQYHEINPGEVFKEAANQTINLMCKEQTAVNLETNEIWRWGDDEDRNSGVYLLKAKLIIR